MVPDCSQKRLAGPLASFCALALALQGCGGGESQPAGDTTPPAAPAALSATAQSTSTIQLNWQAATDADTGVAGYRIFRNASASPIATVAGTSYLDTGLAADTSYSYSVRALDAAVPPNVSAPSASVSARTLPATGQPVSGLDSRPSNTSCLAGDAPTSSSSFATEQVFAGLPAFSEPVLMLQEPASAARWYVVQKAGIVYVFENQSNVSTRRVFINVGSSLSDAGGERGLLGMAFHPGFPANPRVYLSYNANDGSQLVTRVVEYQTRDGGQTLDAASGLVVLQVYQPQGNHNGGHIAFGPDGFLYVGRGDGGGGGDQSGAIGNGQRLSTLLGKILRIDVNATTGTTRYAIPPGNPFAASPQLCNNDIGAFTANCPEIYAYGLRNPWRWSFDRGSGELWLGDVGQGAWEEVNRITAGGNYGWRCREGAHAFNATCGANAASSIDPVAEYGRGEGYSITGGYVYRGSNIPALAGRYVFGDFGSGRIWHIARDTSPTLTVTTGFDSGLSISSFAQDPAGEIYVVNFGGTLHRLRPGPAAGRVIPATLSATGCVVATNATQPASGLVPFAPNAPFWSDGATKSRFLALPDGQRIAVNGDGDFDFPAGSVLMKNFRLGNQLVETRLFMRHNNGEWAGYTYEWNAQGTDATRVVGGKNVLVAGQSWLFPSESQCLLCHTSAAGRTLGLEIAQLNGQLGYAARTANQLDTLAHIDLLSPAPAQPVSQLPALPDPLGTAGTPAQRARAWLHTNCSSCHRPGGPTSVNLDLRYTTPLASTNACEVVPVRNLGVPNARIIAVGGTDPAARSLLVLRPQRTDTESMPPLQPRTVDIAGTTLVGNWINSLTSCN
jgi:uncharacterized repeat protein (TIGR03806 family)